MIKPPPKLFFTAKIKSNNLASLSRAFYFYAGFILVIALISSLLWTLALYNSQKNALQDQLISQSQLIDTQLTSYLNYISHIAEDKGHKIAMKNGDLNYASYLFKRSFFFPVTKSGLKKKAFVWPHFSWVDKKGNILVKSEIGILPKPEKIKESKHFYQSTINSWQLHLSEPYYDPFEEKTFIDASLGVSDFNNEEYLGSITTKFNIEKLVEAITENLRPDTKFIVLDEELKIIIQSGDSSINNDNFFVGKLDNIIVDGEILRMKNQLKYRDNIYEIYKVSSDYSFIILTGYNANSFNKEFTTNLIKRFIALFGAAFFIAIILFLQRQRIIKPINNLAEITKKLGQGKGGVEIIKSVEASKGKYAAEIYDLYQGVLLTMALIDEEKQNKKLLEENNLELIMLNNKLERQNELAKKSTKSREKFLSETRQDIIEDTIRKITKDISTILDHEQGNIMITNQTLIDLHKKMLGSCAKILSYVSDKLNPSHIDIKKIILEAIEMAHYDANINNVELTYSSAEDLADIYVDERSIKHVIIALINYAMEDRKRDRTNSFVKISAGYKKDQEQKFLQIIFEDNGHGISEEMRFNFQQTAQKESKGDNNTSLSLQSIRSILSAHKATLQIDNVLGKGSFMAIQIPYEASFEVDSKNNDEEIRNKYSQVDNVINLFPREVN